jgi:hypothetical protein
MVQEDPKSKSGTTLHPKRALTSAPPAGRKEGAQRLATRDEGGNARGRKQLRTRPAANTRSSAGTDAVCSGHPNQKDIAGKNRAYQRKENLPSSLSARWLADNQPSVICYLLQPSRLLFNSEMAVSSVLPCIPCRRHELEGVMLSSRLQQHKQSGGKRKRSRNDPGATACKSGEQPQGQRSQHEAPGTHARQRQCQ